MPQTRKIGKTATRVYIDEDGYTCVKYHDTIVIMFNDQKIFINHGGWQTDTTRNRINQASSEYNLGLYIIQRKYKWYVTWKGYTIPWLKQVEVFHRHGGNNE